MNVRFETPNLQVIEETMSSPGVIQDDCPGDIFHHIRHILVEVKDQATHISLSEKVTSQIKERLQKSRPVFKTGGRNKYAEVKKKVDEYHYLPAAKCATVPQVLKMYHHVSLYGV
jgi:hypothetical protein